MKKKLLAGLLVLAMVMTFLPVTALADGNPTTFAALQDAVTNAQDGVETTITLGDNISDMGTYLEIALEKSIILDLNGKTLDRGLSGETAAKEGYVIWNKGTLTVKDSSAHGTGKITGGNNLKGKDSRSEGFSGGVYNSPSGKLTLEGGIITGNTAGESGGGVYNKGTFVMTGGIITDNTANGNGGGVSINNDATFTMTGGMITDNTINGTYGGGIRNFGELIIGGTAMVMGNKKVKDGVGSANDIESGNGKTITLGKEDKSPVPGMYVGLIGKNTEVTGAADGQQEYFFADEETKYVKFDSEGTKLVLDDLPNVDENYKITLSYGEGGYITAPQHAKTGEVEVRVFLAEGYRLKSLKVTDSDGVDITVTDNKFTMPGMNVTVTAEFEAIKYTLTNNAKEANENTNHGYIDVKASEIAGETVTITVKPSSGYRLKADSLKVTYNDSKNNLIIKPNEDNENEYTFVMPAYGVTVTAEFEKIIYAITNSAHVDDVDTKHGYITVAENAAENDIVTVTVKPLKGYKLKSLKVTDSVGSDITVTDNKFTMPGMEVTVTAEFEKEPDDGPSEPTDPTPGSGLEGIFKAIEKIVRIYFGLEIFKSTRFWRLLNVFDNFFAGKN